MLVVLIDSSCESDRFTDATDRVSRTVGPWRKRPAITLKTGLDLETAHRTDSEFGVRGDITAGLTIGQ